MDTTNFSLLCRVTPIYANGKTKPDANSDDEPDTSYDPHKSYNSTVVEPRHKQKEREMIERGRSFYRSLGESSLERDLFNQIAGRQVLAEQPRISADFEVRFNQWCDDLVKQTVGNVKRANDLEQSLFEQVAMTKQVNQPTSMQWIEDLKREIDAR